MTVMVTKSVFYPLSMIKRSGNDIEMDELLLPRETCVYALSVVLF